MEKKRIIMSDAAAKIYPYGQAPDYVYGAAQGRTMEQNVDIITDQHSKPDVHIGINENDSPWIPILPSVWIKHLAFDVGHGGYANLIRVEKGGMIGRHRHRGTVEGVCLEGSWKYLEYDWVATAGSYVHETPGAIHTLYSEKGMLTYFQMVGPLEFFDDNDDLLMVHDVFYHINGYTQYCREHSIPINEKLFQ